MILIVGGTGNVGTEPPERPVDRVVHTRELK